MTMRERGQSQVGAEMERQGKAPDRRSAELLLDLLYNEQPASAPQVNNSGSEADTDTDLEERAWSVEEHGSRDDAHDLARARHEPSEPSSGTGRVTAATSPTWEAPRQGAMVAANSDKKSLVKAMHVRLEGYACSSGDGELCPLCSRRCETHHR